MRPVNTLDMPPRIATAAEAAGMCSGSYAAQQDPKALGSAPSQDSAQHPLQHSAHQGSRRGFSKDQLKAYSMGDMVGCFGDGLIWTRTHLRTPQSPGAFLLMGEVAEFDLEGGPAKRGYLRLEHDVDIGEMLSKGMFRTGPCMPAGMMVETSIQMLSFFMVGAGYTAKRDGWRFEPMPSISYDMKFGPQVCKDSKRVSYELFVDELVEGPEPAAFAHVKCCVDGADAFVCSRIGLRLVPDWPLTTMHDLVRKYKDTGPAAFTGSLKLDELSMMNCAMGQPSLAYGAEFRHADGVLRCNRLPNPPYSFLSRIARLDATPGKTEGKPSLVAEYDIPEDAWYFDENGKRTMPYCVLMEVGLQPAGWLAAFTFKDYTKGRDMLFRNLDGVAVQHREVGPGDRRIVTKTTLKSFSITKDIFIAKFDIESSIGGEPVMTMDSTFGFFPPEAFIGQKGLPVNDKERANYGLPGNFMQDLRAHPSRYFGSSARLPASKLLMVDRIVGYWPEGGRAGKGYIRSEKDVVISDWFFKAHFFRDPVQPGSLGVEGIIQLLQFYMLHTGKHKGFSNPVFEPVQIRGESEWHYRGQVIPSNKLIVMDADILEEGKDEKGCYLIAEARLWVDGLKIYQLPKIGMRVVEGAGEDSHGSVVTPLAGSGQGSTMVSEWTLHIDEVPWVKDHRPNFVIAAFPFTAIADMMASAVDATGMFSGMRLVGIERAEVLRWMAFTDDTISGKTMVTKKDDGHAEVTIQLLKKGDGVRADIYEACAKGTFLFSDRYYDVEGEDIPPLEGGVDLGNIYEKGNIFHGPSFHLMQNCVLGKNGARSILDAKSRGVPRGVLNPGLVDAAIHCIPHDHINKWCPDIDNGWTMFPSAIRDFRMYGSFPDEGEIEVEARFQGLKDERFPVTRIWMFHRGKKVASFEWVEVLVYKGKLGKLEPSARSRFLARKKFVRGIALSETGEKTSRITHKDIKEMNWVPETMPHLYNMEKGLPMKKIAGRIVMKEHLAHQLSLHPSKIVFDEGTGRCLNLPFNDVELKVKHENDSAVVESSPISELCSERFESMHGIRMIEEAEQAMFKRFIRRVIVEDPELFAKMSGRPVLFLANHQTGIESALLAILTAGMLRTSIRAIGKEEHKKMWFAIVERMGEKITGKPFPNGIIPFKREDPQSFFNVLEEFRRINREVMPCSMLVHPQGTRSVSSLQKVTKLGSALLDFALEMDMPVIPVKFAGGLPKVNETRVEYPYDFGKQDYYFGRPLLPEELKKMPLKERKEFVIDSINDLGPAAEDDEPIPGDKAFKVKVAGIMEKLGLKNLAAGVLLQTLLDHDGLSSDLRDMMVGAVTKRIRQEDMSDPMKAGFLKMIETVMKSDTQYNDLSLTPVTDVSKHG